MMHPKKEIKLWLIWFTMLLTLLFLVSCKTKHKVIEREKVKETTFKTQDIKELKQKDISIKSDVKITSDIVKITENTEIELTQADANKEITITDALGNQTKIKGANISFKKTQTTEQKKDSLIDKSLTTDKKSSITDAKNTENATKDNVNRVAESDVKTTSTWLWVLFILIIALVFYFNKKTMS